jgi:cysteine synthase A
VKIFKDNAESIGRTPLVQLTRMIPEGAKVYAKVEGRNPAYSVKCRIGANMVWDAEKRGVLMPGMTIIEPTSGNTGIALAYVGAARGYKVKLTMPDTMSLERRRVIAAFGAEIELTDGALGMKGAIERAKELAAENPEQYFMPQQFSNPANPEIHARTTGPEIWNDTDGEVDVLVAGVGTGGTISGTARYLKSQKPGLISVAVEPVDSPVISQHLAGDTLQPGPHRIQGIGAGFIPDNLDLGVVDRVEQVSNDEAFEYARRLAQQEGLLSGISCGAAASVAVRLAADPEFAGRSIVVILPDAGERYLSTPLFE